MVAGLCLSLHFIEKNLNRLVKNAERWSSTCTDVLTSSANNFDKTVECVEVNNRGGYKDLQLPQEIKAGFL